MENEELEDRIGKLEGAQDLIRAAIELIEEATEGTTCNSTQLVRCIKVIIDKNHGASLSISAFVCDVLARSDNIEDLIDEMREEYDN